MAKIILGTKLGNNGDLADFYDDGLQLMGQKSTAAKVLYKDTGATHNKIVITGQGLAWAEDLLTAGKITGVSFTAREGASYVSVTGINVTVAQFNSAYASGGTSAVADLLLGGNDEVTGSRNADRILSGAGNDLVKGGDGADTIDGGVGNDRLYGGNHNDYISGGLGADRVWGDAGVDRFHFESGDGQDVIMDFDAKGGGSKQDYLSLVETDTFTIIKSGRNTVLDFGEGDTLTLMGVKASAFTVADIDFL